jgi:branched-chain amino acid transport system substrate-binding protein
MTHVPAGSDGISRCRKFFWAVCIAVPAAVFAGCRNDAPANKPNAIKIGVIAPFQTQPGEGIRHGAAMAVSEINANGGVNGRKLELVEIDEEYSSEKAVLAYERLAGLDGVAAVIGVAGDGIFSIAEKLQTYKVPMITTGTGSDKLTDQVVQNPDRYRWFFRVMHKSSELGNSTADFAINCLYKDKTINIHKFAIMVEDNIWTKYISDLWNTKLKAAGATVDCTETFSTKTKDFGPIFQRIQNAGAEYILDACSQVDAASYLKRWAIIKGPPIGGVETGSGTERYYRLIGNDGLFVCSVATIPSPENPLTEKSAAWWEKYFGTYGDPAYTSAYTYDAVHILAEALKQAQSTDG